MPDAAPTEEIAAHVPAQQDRPALLEPGLRDTLDIGVGGLMLLACLGGPALAGAIGALGVGLFVGAGGAIFALASCAAVPAVMAALRRRSARRVPAAVVAGSASRGSKRD